MLDERRVDCAERVRDTTRRARRRHRVRNDRREGHAQDRHALAVKGELVFGALGRFDLDEEDLHAMLVQNQSLRGFALLPLLEPEGMRTDLSALFELASSGKLVGIGGRFPLAQTAAAHRALESRTTTGKLALEVEAGHLPTCQYFDMLAGTISYRGTA